MIKIVLEEKEKRIEVEKIEGEVKEVRFWKLDKLGYLSNFWGRHKQKSYQLIIDGHNWTSTEHFYQAQKFNLPGEDY